MFCCKCGRILNLFVVVVCRFLEYDHGVKIKFTSPDVRLNDDNCKVLDDIEQESPVIAQGVKCLKYP
ncbi:hypothetical protein L1887_31897 [Cichorium endivia]|nr:hypothetical protein L1887_31897 [Cichorium endivia]